MAEWDIVLPGAKRRRKLAAANDAVGGAEGQASLKVA